MKRKTLLLSCLLAGSIYAGAANVYCYDFESDQTSPSEVLQGGWVYPESIMLTENPVTDGINPSANCFTFEAQDGIEWWGGPMLTLSQQTTTDEVKYLYIKILAEDSFTTNFQIGLFNGKNENGDPNELSIYLNSSRTVSLGTEWKEFCYEIEPGVTFDNIRLQPRYWGTYYIDDIRLSDEAPVIPDIAPFLIDFESETDEEGWTNNSADGATYRAPLNESPYTEALVANDSEYCMRAWIQNGGWSNYDGARYTNIYGYTTEKSRYLHVRYFFLSNEDHPDDYNLPLCVFTEDGDNCFKSDALPRNQWNDVTIDLGVGTLVKYLAFTVADWWVTAGFDDIQLDGNPTQREELSSSALQLNNEGVKVIAGNNKLSLKGVTSPSTVQIVNLTGSVEKVVTVNSDTDITLQSGVYIVKISSDQSSQVNKVIVK